MQEDIADWINQVFEEHTQTTLNPPLNPDSLISQLSTGVILCQLADVLSRSNSSTPPRFSKKQKSLKNLKNRSMTAPSNHLYKLTGDEESLRYTLQLKTDGDIDDAESVEQAILIFLEQNIDKKFC